MQSSSRNKAKVRVLAVHTTEGIMRAAALRAWTSWPGSSHAAADETGVLLAGAKDGFVDYEQASWTLRSGNPWSENIELCGFAKWKRGDWLARPLLLDACARWLGERAAARGIPLVKLSPKEYAAGRSGVIGHHDHTVGYSDGTHWDPGPDFPYDVVLAQAAAYAGGTTPPPPEEDPFMALTEAQQFAMAHDAANARFAAVNTQAAAGRMELKLYSLEQLLAKIAADGANDLTEADVIEATRQGVAAGVGSIGATVRQVILDTLGEDNADQADEIVDKLVQRLAS